MEERENERKGEFLCEKDISLSELLCWEHRCWEERVQGQGGGEKTKRKVKKTIRIAMKKRRLPQRKVRIQDFRTDIDRKEYRGAVKGRSFLVGHSGSRGLAEEGGICLVS